MKWSQDDLWQKAKLYIARALEEDREGPLFPFWAAMALEFLARAALARIHPVLLADPREGKNILYACGIGQPARPRSIASKTVYERCASVVPGFLERDREFCTLISEWRNEELHTGSPAFHDIPTRLWLVEFYRVSRLLLCFMGLRMEDLFGNEEAKAAIIMISNAESTAIEDVKRHISQAAERFKNFSSDERATALNSGSNSIAHRPRSGKVVSCPACETESLLFGERVEESEPRLRSGLVYQEEVFLPTRFRCFACGLQLRTYGEVHAAGLGGQFTAVSETDPVEYYGSDPEDYGFEEDYGND